MRHAGKEALANLDAVLVALREHQVLVERTPGSFYLKSSGFAHFHEDAAGLFGDLKEDFVSFKRYRVTTRTEQRQFIARVDRCLSQMKARTVAKEK